MAWALSFSIMGFAAIHCGARGDDPAALTAKLRAEYEIFERLRANFPLKERGDKRCPDRDFGKRIRSPGKVIPALDFDHLSYYTSKTPREQAAWRFLRSPGPRRLPPLKRAGGPARIRSALLRVKRLRSRPYIMVVRAVRRWPTGKGDRFQGGVFAGRLVIFDTRDWKPVCGARVLAANSRLVRYHKKGMLASDAEKAVLRDFRENVKGAIYKSLARITSAARVKLY